MTTGLAAHVPLVFVDTNVFYPVRLADLILSSVDDGLFELCVSEHLLAEVERVLVDYKRLPANKAKIFRDAVEANTARLMRTAEYEHLTEQFVGPDADDLRHLCAAIAGGADFLITENTADFATAGIPDGLTPVEIVTPDQFFVRLVRSGFEDDVLETVQRISVKLKKPARTPTEILDGLEHVGLSETVAHVRNYNGPTDRQA